MPLAQVVTSCERLTACRGWFPTGEFASFSVRGRGPRDNLILIDDLPFDRVVHFDQTLGEEEDIGGGGRYSIFAPNSIASAEFSPGGWSAAYGGRSGSLLKLDVAGGSPTPSASLRVDIAGLELGYEGPSGIHDDTTVFLTARQFDFGRSLRNDRGIGHWPAGADRYRPQDGDFPRSRQHDRIPRYLRAGGIHAGHRQRPRVPELRGRVADRHRAGPVPGGADLAPPGRGER